MADIIDADALLAASRPLYAYAIADLPPELNAGPGDEEEEEEEDLDDEEDEEDDLDDEEDEEEDLDEEEDDDA
jgi:hypothetical protein